MIGKIPLYRGRAMLPKRELLTAAMLSNVSIGSEAALQKLDINPWQEKTVRSRVGNVHYSYIEKLAAHH